MNTTAAYLEFEILHNRDIRDSSISNSDQMWKQGQIDLLQKMVNEMDGIYQPSLVEVLMKNMKDMEHNGNDNIQRCKDIQ
jgi:hypothetical protein